MIKLTVDPKVQAAMQRAFPKPAGTAERALKKYVRVLEGMLTKSLQFPRSPIQLKQGWYAISLQQLANAGFAIHTAFQIRSQVIGSNIQRGK